MFPGLKSPPERLATSCFTGVENYIVATWDSPGLEACLDMNLPCYDARALLPLPLGGGAAGEAVFGSPDFLSIM